MLASSVSQLHAKARTDDGDWSPVSIVSGVCNELIAQRQLRESHRQAKVHLHDFFGSGVQKLSIAYQDAKSAARVEVATVRAGDAVDDPRYAEGVVGPSPLLSRN